VLPIDDESMMRALQKNELDAAMKKVVRLANGNFLKAEELIQSSEETCQYMELFQAIMRNCWKSDVKNMRTGADNFAGLGREKQKSFLAYAGNMIRENFIYRLNLPDINYLNREEADFAKNFSPYVNENNVVDLTGEMALAERHIESNVNPRMVFFDLSMKIAVLIKPDKE
jgi:DNA polymerase-3 subunit delta'